MTVLVGNPESHQVHNRIDGLVPIDYESGYYFSHLAGSLHQQELEARPSDDRGPALGLVSVHQPRVDQSPHLGSGTTKI